MSKTKTFLLGTGAAIALTLGACGGDKAASTSTSTSTKVDSSIYALNFEGPDSLMQSVADNPASTTARTDAQKTLALMGMGEDDAIMTWSTMDVDGSVYTFTNVKPKEIDADVTMMIGKVVITNPGMADGKHGVSRIVASDWTMTGEDGSTDLSATIDKIVMIDPPRAIFESLAAEARGGDDAMEKAIENLPLSDWIGGGFILDDLNFSAKSDDGNEAAVFSIDNITMGRDSKTGDGVFDFAGFDMDFKEGDKSAVIKLGRMVMTGLDESIINNFKSLDMSMADFADMANDEEALMSEMYKTFYANFDVYKPMIDGYGLYDFDIQAEGLTFSLDKMVAGYTENVGGKLQAFYKMDDLVFNISDDATDNDMVQAREMMKKLGLETVDMDMIGYCDLYEKEDRYDCDADNNVFTVDNAMTMKFGYDVTGYNSMYKMLASGDATDDAEAMMKAMTLRDAQFTIIDDGILDRGFALGAELSGQSESMIRSQAKMGVMSLGMFVQDDAQKKLVEQFSEAYTAFIDEGGELSIMMNPKKPISGTTFDGLDSSFDVTKLGLSFSHK